MKVVMVFDQIQSGLGTKDDTMLPLGGKKEAVGPAVMMAPFFKEVDGQVIACLYCGNGTFLADQEEVSRKMCAMINKLQPDLVMCGPAFNYLDYAKMCAKLCHDIKETTGIPALAAMSEENQDTIAEYKDKIAIVNMPKKGGFGLNDALKNMCILGQAMADGKDTKALEEKFCFQ